VDVNGDGCVESSEELFQNAFASFCPRPTELGLGHIYFEETNKQKSFPDQVSCLKPVLSDGSIFGFPLKTFAPSFP
jgi:hypothetical protein